MWTVFQSALAAGVADTRLCNTALSQLLHQRDTAKAEQVLAEMDARRIPRSEVTDALGTSLLVQQPLLFGPRTCRIVDILLWRQCLLFVVVAVVVVVVVLSVDLLHCQQCTFSSYDNVTCLC